MLRLGKEEFSTGRAPFSDAADERFSATAKIWIAVRHPNRPAVPFFAEVDTGAPYAILRPELATELGLFDADGEEYRTLTAFGTVVGKLVRTGLVILAEEGRELEIDATVLVSGAWQGPNLLGLSVLERARFAIDPATHSFHFGPG